MKRLRPLPLLAVITLAMAVATPATHAGEVTIYRCTDAKGQLSLRDTPCRAGEKQEARSMVRPADPPPRATPAPAAPAAVQAHEPAPRYIVVTPSRPLYECIAPDGERYTSDTDEGRPRWEPLWTYGYLAYPYPTGGGHSARVTFSRDSGSSSISGSARIGGHPHRPPVVGIVPAYPNGQWVYDECHPLPQADICDRLRDERYELNRRWNIAQPSERTEIDRETRGIDARLANDCGGR
jgi:hypothetical protein